MDAIEKRARKLLDTELRKLGLHEDAYHVGCGADLDRNDQASINAIAAALTPPEGYVLVPVEPTDEMLLAAHRADTTRAPITSRWLAMLAARPEVPS
ncbi:hypothetical protein [Stenotrophomonas maltophilia group sp. Smal35]|uniref:hypothetical protein n=1 Tax=Stenotrophomonas maltophilia group sp. Smal35 TaxID=3377163 RepID=UPI002553BFDA|nr:hypothetical protein [Stenotrophomonas maltophilia]